MPRWLTSNCTIFWSTLKRVLYARWQLLYIFCLFCCKGECWDIGFAWGCLKKYYENKIASQWKLKQWKFLIKRIKFLHWINKIFVTLQMAQKAETTEKRVKDPVSEMRIHRESLKKEHQNQQIYEDFKINAPSKINFFAEKPNNNPFLLMKYHNEGKTINGVNMEEKMDEQMQKTSLTNELSDKLKTVTQVPKDKWNFPQTSNQELGWYVDKMNQDGKFIYKRQGCPETHYADGYYTMKHTSLFSNQKQK